MKIDKAKLLQTLKSDFEAAKNLRKAVDDDIQRRRDTYNGELYGNEQKGKSKIVVKVAKRQEEWAHASLKEPFVSTQDLIKCIPITYEDVDSARQNEILLNYQFCRQFDRYNFITKALKVLEVDATLFIQVGWEYEDEKIEVETEVIKIDENDNKYISKEIVEDIKIIKNRPTAKVCRSEDIFVDPTCQDNLDEAQFIVYRYETDLSTLRKDGRYKNLDKVAKKMSKDDDYYWSKHSNNTFSYVDNERESFEFSDTPRKKVVVYEYWGNYDINNDGIAEPIVCAWIDDIIIRLQDNPYPDKKPPFISCPASPVPFQLYGENNIDLIEDQQKVITGITRGIINNMAASNNGQIGIRKGALDPMQKKNFLSGKNFEFNGTPNDIWQGSYNQIPASAFNMLQLMNADVESLTGVKSFSGGITGQSLGPSATAARGVMDATAVRRLDNVRNFAENLIKPLLRKWIAYNAEFLSPTEVVRVTNSEFVEIRRDDLEGKIDLSITISTPEDDAAKRQELAFMLQTMGNSLPFEMTKKILAQIAKLNRMPDLEKDIKEFAPEPNQDEIEMRQLEKAKIQSEIAKNKAESMRKYAEAHEDKEGDTEEKQARAELLKAQAKLLESKADMEDLKFLKTNMQVDEKFQLEKLKLEQEYKASIEALKAKYNHLVIKEQVEAGDTNIGIPY